MFEMVIIAHASGFLMGAGLMYVIVRALKRVFLDMPASPVSMSEMASWYEHNRQNKLLILATRHELDKISGSVG